MSPGLKRWSVAIFVFGLTLFFSGPARAGFRLEMEAEEADGVAFYPDWHTMAGQGWYAMEQKYFSGYAGLICDAQSTGARATFTLKQAIPPGRYRFFLYLVKMREGGKNGLQVKLGSEQWDVIWDGSTYPVRDYAVQAHDLVLTEPAKEISFTSLMIQRHNIGDVPGYPLPAIMLDRFLLTDDLSLKVIRRGSRQDVGLVDLSEEKIRPVTASLPSGNRLRNGSFEVGTTTTWFSFGQPLGPENLVAGGVDGQRCLLLPSGLNWPSRGIFSSVFSGSSGEKVPVSLFLKSSRDTKIKLSVIASTRKETPALTVKANENWQKFETVVSLPEDATGRYSLAIRPESDDRVDVWVDACSVGLAQGQDYLPDREQEFALQSERLANIYHDRENVPAILTVANHASKIYQSELEIVIRDHRDAVTGRQRISLICQAGKRQEKKVNLACGRWGIFSAVLTEKETGKDLAELCYINLPAVSERNELIGFYGSAWNERNMAIFEDLGIAWIATLADGQARHIRSEGFEELVRVLSVPARHRVGVVYATEILFHRPQQDLVYPGTTSQFQHPPELSFLKKDLLTFARRFCGQISAWILQDELYEGKCPLEAWPLYHKVAVEAIRKADPQAIITVSSEPSFQERVLKILGRDYLSAVCDCTYNPLTSWRYQHLPYQHLARKYNLPLWFSGFGFPTTTFYRTRSSEMSQSQPDYSVLVDRTAKVLLANGLEFGAERFLLYSAVPVFLHPAFLRPTNIYDVDGSLVALVPAYVAAGRILQGATQARKLAGPDENLAVFTFIKGGHRWLVFWVDPGLGSYGNHSPGQYVLEIGLKAPVMDIFGNNYPVTEKDGDTRIRFNGEVLLADVGNLSVEEISSRVKESHFSDLLPVRAVVTADRKGNATLEIVMQNGTDREIKGELTVTEARGLLAEGDCVSRKAVIPSGKEAEFRLPLQEWALKKRVLSNSRVTVCLPGRSTTVNLWALPARQRQVPPKIDGFLNDWERNSPGFIYVTTRSSGGYGRIQAREGSEHLTLINPLQVRIFVSWDKENLYLAGHKVDREIIPASGQEWPEDGLIFCLDSRLKADLFNPVCNEDDYLVSVSAPGEKARACLIGKEGEKIPLEAAWQLVYLGEESGYTFEVAVPWKKLGVVPESNMTLGFDLTVLEASQDREKRIEAAWAGYGHSLRTPTGWGQLLLRGDDGD